MGNPLRKSALLDSTEATNLDLQSKQYYPLLYEQGVHFKCRERNDTGNFIKLLLQLSLLRS